MKNLLVTCLLIVFISSGKATIILPPIIADHMVMQQNAPVKLWGNANAGEQVTISILQQTVVTHANSLGKWMVWLQPLSSSIPIEMKISGSNNILIKDILLGDVWLASGQSNMEWKVKQSTNADKEIKAADYPKIRLFIVRRGFSDTALSTIQGKWELCSPATAGNFSAVAYFFGRDLFLHNHIPLGMIEADWGGTNCQAWTPLKAIEENPRCQYILDNWKKVIDQYPSALQKYQHLLANWKSEAVAKKTKGDSVPPPRAPSGRGSKEAPGSIYNGTIAPIAGYTIKGVIWYQGEANAYQYVAYPYRYLFPTLITAWRKEWGQGNFPFLFVQLSSLSKHPYWPVLRESQSETLNLTNTAMAVSLDVGDSMNAHYKNKQVIGHRLYLAAIHLISNEQVEYSGPVYRQLTFEDKGLRVWFDHAKSLKTTDQAKISGFTIAGIDGNFITADAVIEG